MSYREWWPVEFEIAETAAGSTPAIAAVSKVVELSRREFNAHDGQPYRIEPNGGVALRHGDTVLGRGKLDRPPCFVFVSSRGLGFVGLDVYGYNYAYSKEGQREATAATIVSASGKIAHTARLPDLYSAAELMNYDATAGGLRWLNYRDPGWIDEKLGRVVIIGASSESQPNRLTRFLEWESGTISIGPTLKSQQEVSRLRESSGP